MDDRDEYEPEAEEWSEPVTERVRIIGAQPAGAAVQGSLDDDASDVAPTVHAGPDVVAPPLPAFDDVDEHPVASRPDVSGGGAEPATRNGGDPLEPGSQVVRVEPAPSVPDMPHWTDPPTGQVPAVLDRRADDEDEPDQWSAPGDTGPAWREHHHEWDDSFEPSLLADDETRVGALEETPVEERRPWEFDDLAPAPTADRGDPAAAGTEGAGWWDDADAEPEPGPVVIGSGAAAPASARVSAPTGGDDQREAGEPGVASISSSPLRLGPREPAAATGPPPAPGRGPRPGVPAAGGSGRGPNRNMPVAIATGIGFALLAVICFEIGTVATVALSTVVVLLAAAECYAALRHSGRRPATFPGLVATVMIMVAAYAKGVAAIPLVLVLTVVTALLWYLVGAERGSAVEGVASTIFGFAWVGLLGSFAGLLLAPSLFPHRHGIAFFFGAIVATIGADVGALAVGSWLGRHPLAPRISPGKTWEGLIGGAIAAIALSAAVTGQVHPWTVPKAALLGVVAAVVAPLGDLCESLVKRDLGLKDMGSLLPGHGGVLDRMDALLFVLPATYYLVRVLNLG